MIESKSWNRLRDETAKAFAAFCIFRDMPDRTVIATAGVLSKSVRLMNRWAARYAWWERALDFDNHCDEERVKKVIAGRAKMAESLVADAVHARAVAMEILRKIEARIQRGERLPSVMDAARLLSVAAALETSCRGEPTEEAVTSIIVHVGLQSAPRYRTFPLEGQTGVDRGEGCAEASKSRDPNVGGSA